MLSATMATVFFAEFLRIEFLNALVSIANDPQQLLHSTRRTARLHRWGDFADARREWLTLWPQELDVLLTSFRDVVEVAFDRSLIPAIANLMAEYHLKSYDAMHLATALAAGADTFATLDADFLPVPADIGLTIHLIR